MKIETYFPSKPLQPFIKSYMVIESVIGMQNRILPETGLIMAFCFKGQITGRENGLAYTLPHSAITGLKKSYRLLTYAENTATILVKLKETGPLAFFDVSPYEFFNTSLSLDDLLDHHVADILSEQLSETETNLSRVSIIENFLLHLIKDYQPDPLVSHAIEKIKHTEGNIRIRELSQNLHISLDPFEKRFRKVTGASPKQFAKVVRLKRAISNYSEETSLTDLALNAGFFDQAHFIKTFKDFTGQTPQSFFKEPPRW